MSSEENKAIARRFVEEMMDGQHVERIDEFVAPVREIWDAVRQFSVPALAEARTSAASA